MRNRFFSRFPALRGSVTPSQALGTIEAFGVLTVLVGVALLWCPAIALIVGGLAIVFAIERQ